MAYWLKFPLIEQVSRAFRSVLDYYRTTETHTFLWWANVAARVHEQYKSFFPGDVRYVADHAKRAITEFPLSLGKYYGVDYGERAQHGVPDEEMPACFVQDGSYAANDLGWYANIPVPTSYMIANSRGDFSGGYDHKRGAGFVHFANHHIAPGKKQWTWGNHEFGYAWDRCLTDTDGPYVELMAGAYSDNQPDFSFLAPGETKTFSQYWYPIRDIGVPDLANLEAALRVERTPMEIRLYLLVTSNRPESQVLIRIDGQEVGRWQGDLFSARPLHLSVSAAAGDLEISVEQAGNILLSYRSNSVVASGKPVVATEPPAPKDVRTAEELYLIGLHLEQYRHPTRAPEAYWQEALRRDPKDSRANHALGKWHLRRGEFAQVEAHVRTAIARLTERNPNPYDGEPHYTLGLTLTYMNRTEEAYAAFYKSTWNAAWRGPAYHRLAEIDCVNHAWAAALEHIDHSLRAGTENLNARNLKTIILNRLGRNIEADEFLRETRTLDPVDVFSRFLTDGSIAASGQQRIDLVFDFLRAGLREEALTVASFDGARENNGAAVILLYARAYILRLLGEDSASIQAGALAAAARGDFVFPNRIEEMLLLEEAIRVNPKDARAPFYLGNLLYDRRRHHEAIALWEQAAALDPDFPTAWRNLGFGYYNVLHDTTRALHAFAQARNADPLDARILYEQDQLLKRTGKSLEKRLATLTASRNLVDKRDDLSLELANLYASTSQPQLALDLILGRQFQPWEGGEGHVLSQFVRANILLGRRALLEGRASDALDLFLCAQNPPLSIGEAKHLLMNLSMIDYWLGVAYCENGMDSQATLHLERAARQMVDFQHMQVQSISDTTYWSAMALHRLGRKEEAKALFQEIFDYATALSAKVPKIDYFATSLPDMLLFEEDLQQRQHITVLFLKAQALLGLGNTQDGCDSLRKLRELDQSHCGAIDLLRSLEG